MKRKKTIFEQINHMKRRSRKAWCMCVCVCVCGGGVSRRSLHGLNPGENTMCGCTSGGGEVGSSRTLFEYPQNCPVHWRLAAGPGFKNSCHLLNDVSDKFQRLATISDYRLDVYVHPICAYVGYSLCFAVIFYWNCVIKDAWRTSFVHFMF